MARIIRASMGWWPSFSSPSSSSLAGRCCRWSLRCYSTTSQPPVPLPSTRPPFRALVLARQTVLALEAFFESCSCATPFCHATLLVCWPVQTVISLSRALSRARALALALSVSRASLSLSLSSSLYLTTAVGMRCSGHGEGETGQRAGKARGANDGHVCHGPPPCRPRPL